MFLRIERLIDLQDSNEDSFGLRLSFVGFLCRGLVHAMYDTIQKRRNKETRDTVEKSEVETIRKK